MNVLYHVFHFSNRSVSCSRPLGKGYTTHYDLTLVLRGKLLYIVEGEPLLLEQGDVMLLPPNTYRFRNASNEEVHYVSFNFFTDEPINLPMYMKDAVTNEIRGLLKVFAPLYLTASEQEKAGNVVGYILAVLNEAQEISTQNPHIKRAFNYIDEHISEPISLSNIAAALHFTREYTSKLFKKETGMTVTRYVNDRKLSLALSMIRDQNESLSEIAKSLGYKNYTYFSTAFKMHFGVSPSHFRK